MKKEKIYITTILTLVLLIACYLVKNIYARESIKKMDNYNTPLCSSVQIDIQTGYKTQVNGVDTTVFNQKWDDYVESAPHSNLMPDSIFFMILLESEDFNSSNIFDQLKFSIDFKLLFGESSDSYNPMNSFYSQNYNLNCNLFKVEKEKSSNNFLPIKIYTNNLPLKSIVNFYSKNYKYKLNQIVSMLSITRVNSYDTCKIEHIHFTNYEDRFSK
jgi:hypothetical protein